LRFRSGEEENEAEFAVGVETGAHACRDGAQRGPPAGDLRERSGKAPRVSTGYARSALEELSFIADQLLKKHGQLFTYCR
jgi:hypothetical protein